MMFYAFRSARVDQPANGLIDRFTISSHAPASLVCILALLVGCHVPETYPANSTSGVSAAKRAESTAVETDPPNSVDLASRALTSAIELHGNLDPHSSAQCFVASTLALRAASDTNELNERQRDRAAAVYHASLRQLIESTQQFDQIDPVEGIALAFPSGTVRIPIRYHGFAWKPEDFNRWIPVDEYEHKKLARKHQSDGWGLPVVVVRERNHDEPFMVKRMPFAATVVLRNPPVHQVAVTDESKSMTGPVLDVFNPLMFRSLIDEDGILTPIASDISAPVAWLANNTPHLTFEAFLHPDRMQRSGHLTMIEPYQRGKIPLILVHGLASDPLTWTGMINELRATDWFNRHYQVWVFGYSTGRPFLRSAAELRRLCHEVATTLTRDTPDHAMHKTVMIGHSMGGLVTKLQVTDSEDQLWAAFANQPLESLHTDESFRELLSELFFFRPSPFVSRAIFIGTPHGGSPIAKELVGRLASQLVVRSHDISEAYDSFVAQNRGAITPFFSKHLPTSVDMLEAQDPALKAMQRLRVPSHVRMHSVIGNGQRMLVGGPADGTVPVKSARHKNTDSELIVSTTHRRLQSHPETVQEVLRILRQHIEESDAISLAVVD